jgi:hypothetical protein
MSDALRDRLAEALREITVPRIAGPESHMADNLAAALVPTIEQIAKERAGDYDCPRCGGSGEVPREEGRRIERNAWLKALDDSHLPSTYRRLVRDLALAPCGNCGGDAATCDCDES